MTELIDKIPTIISYIIYGYAYLTAYYWVSYKDNKDFNNLIIKSIATSYLLTNVFDLLIKKYTITFENDYEKVIKYFVISATLGLLIGKLTTHRYFNHILHTLHIGRTTNSNIWDDVIRPRSWVRIFMKDGSSYLGQYRYGELFQREPIIALITWQKLDDNSDVIIDNSQNPNELILLNTKDFEKIEITYDPYEKWYIRVIEKIKKMFYKEENTTNENQEQEN